MVWFLHLTGSNKIRLMSIWLWSYCVVLSGSVKNTLPLSQCVQIFIQARKHCKKTNKTCSVDIIKSTSIWWKFLRKNEDNSSDSNLQVLIIPKCVHGSPSGQNWLVLIYQNTTFNFQKQLQWANYTLHKRHLRLFSTRWNFPHGAEFSTEASWNRMIISFSTGKARKLSWLHSTWNICYF